MLSAAMSPGVRQGAYFGVPPPDEVTPATSSGPPAHWRWDTEKVGGWLAEMGLRDYRETFGKHRITGDLLEQMDREDLRDLGVNLVGHRLLLLREIAALRRTAESRERSRLLWQADEVLHRDGALGYVKSIVCCRACLVGPDRYTLTGSSLIILSRDHHSLLPCLVFCTGERSTTRNVDLSSVAGVTAHQSGSLWDCGCSADDVVVSVNMELGLPPVPPLRVQRGYGRQVAQIIREAADALHAPNLAPTPTPQAMHRGA